jgi:predicted nucleic acid-binding protein
VATDTYLAPYIDSSVFIAWINKEVVNGEDRFTIADHVIKKAERGEYTIYISALTLSEVHKLPRGTTPPLTKEQDEMIIRFFQNDWFRLLPIDRDIGETANRFCRDYGIHGNDATHLACALRAKCDVLLVWDRPLATKVTRTDIRIESPRILGQVFLAVPTETGEDDKA